jgi:hypothetical protein
MHAKTAHVCAGACSYTCMHAAGARAVGDGGGAASGGVRSSEELRTAPAFESSIARMLIRLRTR